MKRIAFCVITLHLIFVFSFVFFKREEIQPEIKKLAVKQYQSKPIPERVAKAPAPAKKIAPVKAPAPPAPKKAVSKPAPAVPPPPPKPIKKVEAPQPKAKPQAPEKSPLTQKLIEELEESIAKIEGGHDKVDKAKQINTPRAIETLHVDTAIEKESVKEGYTRTLITCLQESLNLPDFGEVTIELTLKQDGRVEKLAVLKTESENNRRYLEMHLPHVKFPALNKPGHTFVLTFCNEV